MLFITPETISRAAPSQLKSFKIELEDDQEKLDDFFTVFLKKAKLRESKPDHPDWTVYREMMKEAERIDDLIRSTDYYMGKHP